MKVVIAKVDQVYFDGEAVSLTVPGAEGEMTVLPKHMSMVTTLKQGKVVVRVQGGEDQTFAIEDGVLEVTHDGATILL